MPGRTPRTKQIPIDDRAEPSTVLDQAWIAIPLGLAALVYYPITRNYFFAGDFHNFYLFLNHGLVEFVVAPHGGHLLITRNAIWWLLYQLFGLRAEVYFATVLVTHLIAVGLLFSAARRLTGSARAACVVASLWGSAPVQQGTLGWYSVYGQVLVTALLAWMVFDLSRIDARGVRPRMMVRWGVLLVAAVTSFGVGIGIALVFPLVAFLLLPTSPGRRRTITWLSIIAAAVPLLYWALLQLYQRVYAQTGEIGIVYAGAKFPLTVVQLFVHMIGDGAIALHGSVAAGWLQLSSATSYAVAAAYLVTALAVALRAPMRQRRLLLAGLLLCLSCYALIAIGRAPFSARGLIGPMARAPRYHYAATWGMALVTAVMLAQVGARLPARFWKDVALGVFAVGLLFSQLRWRPSIEHYDTARREAEATGAAILSAIDAAPQGSDVYIENRPFAGIGGPLQRRMDLFPGWAGVFVIFFPENVIDGHRVYFVSAPKVVTATRHGARTATLLVAEQP
jgi:hypothetical protein